VTLRLVGMDVTHPGGRTVRRSVVLGQAASRLAAGSRRVMSVRLNGAGRRMLARRGVLTARLVVSHSVSGRTRRLSSRAVTLRMASRPQ
jgi:hypothetical protein